MFYDMSSNYDWKFSTIGNVVRVCIEKGADIVHLGELDQKLWTVLSCPVNGLELDEKTLMMMDIDGDGKIRVKEVVAAAEWLCSVIKDPDMLLRQEDFIPLSAFNLKNVEGKRLHDSAKQILANLGLNKDRISIADTADSMAIFAKTRFNGDGIITENSTDNDLTRQTIAKCIKTIGSVIDRSGDPGVNNDIVDKFYSELSDYADWMNISEKNSASVLPYGDNTSAALDVCNLLKDKIEDYFMRCKLIAFDNNSTSALDVSVSRIEAISANNLGTCMDEIASYPLARVNSEISLPLKGINPAWQESFDKLKKLVFDIDFPGNSEISEPQWKSILAKLNAYSSWISSKKGTLVESLGYDAVKLILSQNNKSALIELINEDKKLEAEAGSIDTVNKLLHFYRDIYRLIKNFVSFQDFYSRNSAQKAIFQAGKLFIDQRSLDLCFKVSDMDKHNTMAGQSGMFIIYCNCISKTKDETMTIAAVMTDGEVKNIVLGKNALFYDNDGLDWDATVIKIIDNPISIRQGFWQPYRKFGKFIENQINKVASSQDNKVTSSVSGKIDDVGNKVAEKDVTAVRVPDTVETKKAQAFDIAKFAGIFAAIGLALGYIGSFLSTCIGGFVSLNWWQMILVIPGLMLIISGPSMIMAWMKLRKRNISPILNANGWAVNSQMMINITFGQTLTQIANLPKLDLTLIADPFADKKMSKGLLVFIITSISIIALFALLFFTNSLKCIGLPFKKEKGQTEVVIEPTVANQDTVSVNIDIP